MCTGAEIAVLAQIGGTVAGTVGAIQQGKAAKKAGEYNAAVSVNQARRAQHKADFDAKREREKTIALLSQQQAQFGGSGARAGEGTPLMVMSAQAAQGELDAQAIIHGGRVNAAGFMDQASISRLEGENAKDAAYSQAGTTLLTGGGGAASSASKLPPSSPLHFSSDVRLKKNVHSHGTLNGHKIYSFQYIWGGPIQLGVMAHEVIKYLPDAVSSVGSFLQVDYGKLGFIKNG